MSLRSANAVWAGNLKEGSGTLRLGSGLFESKYTFSARFEEEPGTNPEELIAAAHAACYSMYLSALLSDAGFVPEKVETTAKVQLGAGPAITKISLFNETVAPGVSADVFAALAAKAKEGCPISKALSAVEIVLEAGLG